MKNHKKRISHGYLRQIIATVTFLSISICLFAANTGNAQNQNPGPEDDTVGSKPKPALQDFPQTELGRQLSEHLKYMTGVGKEAEKEYQVSLGNLRKHAPAAVLVLAETFPKIKADRYFRRWAIVETIRELGDNSALTTLSQIAVEPIPAEHWNDPERFSVDKEISIRVTAVEGLSKLAAQGNKDAEKALLNLVSNKELGIRRQAIRGYLGAGRNRDKRARSLRSMVSRCDQGLVTLEVTDVRKVPYPKDIPEDFGSLNRQKDDDAPGIKGPIGSYDTRTLFKQVSFTKPALNFTPPAPLPASCMMMPGDNNDSGDLAYGPLTCDQVYINMFWNHFDFDKDDWDNGFGYEASCDQDRPLARTFNALYLLAYSAEDYATDIGDISGNALRWGYPYSASKIDELDGRCGTGDPATGDRARTYWGALQDDRTVLNWPFFYGEVVVERAGTIVHEARHASGKDHNGGSACPRGASCDTEWIDQGANMYQTLYLWWFSVDGTRTTTGMKNYARQEAQRIIDEGFITNPGFVL